MSSQQAIRALRLERTADGGYGANMMASLSILFFLFSIAFLAATILPLQSEAVLAGLLVTSGISWPLLLGVAALGNTLGAGVNWWMGRSLLHWQDSRWFPASPQRLEQAKQIYARYGRWCLVFAWLPVVGDALTVVAGVLGERLSLFLLLVGIGKTLRYLVIAAATAGFL